MNEKMSAKDIMMMMRGKCPVSSKYLSENFSKDVFEFHHMILMNEGIQDEQLIPCLETYQSLADFVDFHLLPLEKVVHNRVLDMQNVVKLKKDL